MNVAVFLGGGHSEVEGGTTLEREVQQALRETYPESGHRFHLLSPGPLEPTPDGMTGTTYQSAAGIEGVLGRLDSWFPTARRHLMRSGRLGQILREREIDVVWFVGPTYTPTDRPYLCGVTELQHRRQPWFPTVSTDGEWLRREQYFSRKLQGASVVLTGTETAREEVERCYAVPTANFRVLPYPTPGFALEAPREMGADVRERFGLPAEYLLYPARFAAHKNHVGLLRALALVRDRHRLVLPLVLVGGEKGDEPGVRIVERMARELGLQEQVRALGVVSRDDLVGLYRGAFALVYPSFFGPEKFPPLEAFALGCPVIASELPGAQDHHGGAAILVDPADEQRMAHEIHALHNDPAMRRALVERGRVRAARWTARDYVRGIYAALDDLAPYVRCWREPAARSLAVTA